MPSAPLKPCNDPGCGQLVSGRYCKEHEEKHRKSAGYQHTKTSTQRGYGYKWQKLRQIVFKRDNKLCQICLSNGRVTVAMVVDHIKPKAKGGTDDMANLQSLCPKCHDYKTATEDSKGGGI